MSNSTILLAIVVTMIIGSLTIVAYKRGLFVPMKVQAWAQKGSGGFLKYPAIAKGLIILALPLVMLVLISAFSSLFPNLWDRYLAWGGPVSWLVLAVLVIGLVMTFLEGKPRGFAIGGITLIVGGAVLLALSKALFLEPPCPVGDKVCLQKRYETALVEQKYQELASFRKRADEVALYQPASSADCPGTPPDMGHPIILQADVWKSINPGKKCDVAYTVLAGIAEFQDSHSPQESWRRTTKIDPAERFIYLTAENARGVGGSAKIILMLCPKGAGPLDQVWQCQMVRRTDTASGYQHVGVEVGVSLGANAGVYYK